MSKLIPVEKFLLGLVERFFFGTSLLEPVSFSNRFIQTGFYLGNRFKVNKKIIFGLIEQIKFNNQLEHVQNSIQVFISSNTRMERLVFCFC